MPRRTNKETIRAAHMPETGLFVGDKATAAMFGVHEETIGVWRRKHGFPGAKLPGKEYAVTFMQIDEWLRSRQKSPMDQARLLLSRLSPEDRTRLLNELSVPYVSRQRLY